MQTAWERLGVKNEEQECQNRHSQKKPLQTGGAQGCSQAPSLLSLEDKSRQASAPSFHVTLARLQTSIMGPDKYVAT